MSKELTTLRFGRGLVWFYDMEMPVDALALRGFEEAIELAAAGHYAPLATAIADKVRGGDAPARQTIAVQFVIDAALRALRFEPRLSYYPEITSRAAIAGDYVAEIVKLGVNRSSFVQLHLTHKPLRDLIDSSDLLLENEEYMLSLSAAVFSDTSAVMGGAHRVLVSQGYREGVTDIIGKSSGLTIVSGIGGDKFGDTWDALGFPYVKPEFLLVDAGPEVKFTAAARALIAAASVGGDGCPAQRIANPYGEGTVLGHSWRQLAGYLVPEGATSVLPDMEAPPLL